MTIVPLVPQALELPSPDGIYQPGTENSDFRTRSLLEDLLPQNTQIQDFEVEHDFEQIGPKKMLVNANKIPH
jgi:hypothetical protein